jgi:tellurite resistance protein
MTTAALRFLLLWGCASLAAATVWSCIGMARHNAEVRRARRERAAIATDLHDALTAFRVDATWAFNAALHPPTNSPIYDQLAAEQLAAELEDDDAVARWLA